jgi:hypothetical protein
MWGARLLAYGAPARLLAYGARPARLRALGLVLSSSVAACGPAPEVASPGKAPTTATAAPAASGSAAAANAASAANVLPDDADVLVTLSPEPSPQPLVRVTIVVRPEEAPLATWTGDRALTFVEPPQAFDAGGRIGAAVSTGGEGTRVTLERAPNGVTRLSYAVRAELPAFPDPPAIAVDPDRFEGAGEALVLLPASFAARTLRAVIRVETDEIGTAELVGAASSFGHGSRVEATARGADLQGAFYLAGLIGRATFRAPEGNDDAAWLGYTAFDPRPVFADMAGLRTSLRQIFGAPDADKLTFLFLSDSRPPGSFAVTRRARSVVARIGVQETWSAPVRIAVAAAVVHGWIGSRLWVGPDEPAREREAYWFTEGVTRHLARDLLFRYGLISPAESAAEVEGLASVLATSDAASLSNQDLARRSRGALPVLVARGALYALRADALLRVRTGKKRLLENVLRELYQEAATKKSALPASACVDHLVKDLGDGERAVFRDAIELGKPAELPDGALGPCFRRVTRTYVGFDIGFDEDASRKGSPAKLLGLVKGGPAEKAGLREGDEIVTIQAGARSPGEEVHVTVAQGDRTKTFHYRPEGRRNKGVGFERKKDVSDDACTQ